MPPLTLTILASVLQMQGADATITSDNKGIEELLAPIRSQLREQVSPNTSPRMLAAAPHHRGLYTKVYTKVYAKYDIGGANKPAGGATPAGGALKPAGGGSSGGGHR